MVGTIHKVVRSASQRQLASLRCLSHDWAPMLRGRRLSGGGVGCGAAGGRGSVIGVGKSVADQASRHTLDHQRIPIGASARSGDASEGLGLTAGARVETRSKERD